MTAILVSAGRIASGDGPHLVGVEIRLAQLIMEFEFGRALRLFSTLIAPQPPAGYLPGIVTALVLGATKATPIIAMAIPLLLCWDAFRRLNDGRSPWAAWLVLVASPITWLYVEEHGRDLVAGAVLAQTVAWLYASRGFTDRGASIAFGVWLAVGFLTKYTFPMFAAAPCLAAAIHLRSRERWKHLGFAFLAFAVVAGPWFLSYAERVASYVLPTDAAMATSQAMNRGGRDQGFTSEMLLLYPVALKDALGWPGVVTLLMGGALAPVRSALALLAAVGGVAILSPLEQAQDRYAIPAVVLLASLAGPLSRSRVGAAVVLAVFLPQLVATIGVFKPGAPAASAPTFDHSVSAAKELSWPKSRSYRPVDFDVRGWKVDEAIAGLRRVHGRADGTVGLLLPRSPVGPDFGIFLARSMALGNRWDFANVNLSARHGGLSDPFFMGPMRDGSWPPSSFTALYAILATGDGDAASWIASRRDLVEDVRIALPNASVGVLYRVGP